MHTSTRLTAADFQFWQETGAGNQPISFAAFCPNYHELDRVGVVSLRLEDGVCQTGRTLLALTTAFYDRQRAKRRDFFDYPQHFAFVGVTAAGIQCGTTHLPHNTPQLWDAWSWLDVWPANKWITAQPTASAMLQQVFDFQINRLFWPHALQPQMGEAPLADYVYKMLRTRLCSVYLYAPSDTLNVATRGVSVRTSPVGESLLHESLAKLPNHTTHAICAVDRLQAVSVDHFIAQMQVCRAAENSQ